jgi:hypothetical protein
VRKDEINWTKVEKGTQVRAILAAAPAGAMFRWTHELENRPETYRDETVPVVDALRWWPAPAFLDITAVALFNENGFPLIVEKKMSGWRVYSELVQREDAPKDTNPKDSIGIKKLPLHLVSGVVKAYQAVAHYLGNVKYGAWNYRGAPVTASVYASALMRHFDRWWEGEEFDPTDGTPHLANALCCINILIEAKYGGTLVDDRPPSRDLGPLYTEFEAMMAKIREKYADHPTPKHYTIKDTK